VSYNKLSFVPAAASHDLSDAFGASGCSSVRSSARMKKLHTEGLIKAYNKLNIHKYYYTSTAEFGPHPYNPQSTDGHFCDYVNTLS
jgi:hypothetical protein